MHLREREYLWPLKKKKRKVQEMHKIKVQSVTFKMPYLEANKTKLFLGVGKQFSNTTVEHLFFNHTELRRYVLSSYRAKNKGKQKMRVWNALF